MAKGKQIEIKKIMGYIQEKNGWERVNTPGQGIITFTEFQNVIVFEMDLTSDMRKIREMWKILQKSPATKCYRKDKDLIIVEISIFNELLKNNNYTGTERISAEKE